MGVQFSTFRRAYPRRRGGNLGESFGGDRDLGLSPQARGEHLLGPSLVIRGGPIPAGAGGTAMNLNPDRMDGAYPRRRGGNFSGAVDTCFRKGLSPQARGEQ